ncbi:MAG TPA: selenocysteine-specific translation elongation factor [Rubrobacter sp.]|jgi:selenocysteine-specific elongation factor|nr:selenocysteine-specific translation elongation factor [Rubrobacter sp.]
MRVGEAGEHRISLTIGTAGHVDHGKTTLVRYMTGTDTDRLEEEHRRGISIVPGYAELDLPSGRRASLVDVPGHERFVKNMVSGSTGVDAFLLVVAADDGVMPQTSEHLDILRILGVEQGVVALSKVDAVDEETVELAALDVEDLLDSRNMNAPVIHVSGATGEGVENLLLALDALAGETADRRKDDLARLPVDRSFVLKGIGVVVTGTLWSGEIRPGDVLYTPTGLRPRVRGVQNHGHPAEVAYAGARTALDLTGVEASEIEAGDVLLSSPVPTSRDLDVRVRLLESAKPLAHGIRVRLHHGTRSTNARVRLTDREELEPGAGALARLRLDEPFVTLRGDRFVLRSMDGVTVGGGTVLDPSATGRRPDPSWLEALESGDAARAVPHALARRPTEGMTTEDLSLALGFPADDVSRAVETSAGVETVGEIHAAAGEVAAARERFLEALERRAAERPESPELSIAEARTATGLSLPLADALLGEIESEAVTLTDKGVSLKNANRVPPELEREAEQLLEDLRAAGPQPPTAESTPAMRLLLKRKDAVELGNSLFAAREAAESVLDLIKTICRERGEISLAGLRDSLGTSRKYAQAWLEYSDACGVTSRTGDVRVLTRRHRHAM